MIFKVHFPIILLLMLALGRLANAQSLNQIRNGTITVRVACNCQLITYNSNQPLHFMACGKYQRDTKHLKIKSNCSWNLRVVTNKSNYERDDRWDDDRNNCKENNKNKKSDSDKNKCVKQDESIITYTFKNFRGKGRLLNPNEKYVLGLSPQNLPSGLGELEFDVVFELERSDNKKPEWGKDNTWVSFYVLPKE